MVLVSGEHSCTVGGGERRGVFARWLEPSRVLDLFGLVGLGVLGSHPVREVLLGVARTELGSAAHEISPHVPRLLVAFVWVPGKGLHHDALEVRREGGNVAGGFGNDRFAREAELVHLVLGPEEPLSGEHLPHHDAKGIEVRTVILLELGLLRRHVGELALDDGGGFRPRELVGGFRHPKVDQLDRSVETDEDVGRGNVPVHDVQPFRLRTRHFGANCVERVAKSLAHLDGDVHNHLRGHSAHFVVCTERAERLPSDVLLREVVAVVDLVQVGRLHDVCVVQDAARAGFVKEHRFDVEKRRALRLPEELHGSPQWLRCAGIQRFADDAKGTASNLPYHDVAAKLRWVQRTFSLLSGLFPPGSPADSWPK